MREVHWSSTALGQRYARSLAEHIHCRLNATEQVLTGGRRRGGWPNQARSIRASLDIEQMRER